MKNDDVELIQRVLAGDDDAFSVLVRKYQRQVHALAWRKIGDFHIAEEITQDTFLKAYKQLAFLKHPQRFVGWLYVIAANLCNTWLRKKRLWTQPLEHLEQADKEQLEKTAYSEFVVEENERISGQAQRDVVKKLLAKLDESERTVMTLHYFGEMSCTEIGTFLGVSANTIKSRLRRAQQRLKKEETVIREALDNFKISPNLTETIMQEISRAKPTAPSGSKPLVPWAIAASTVVVVLLMLGFGNSKYLARFQDPYSFDSTTEMTVDIIDAPIVADLESKPDVRTKIGSTNALAKLNEPEQHPNNALAATAEAQVDEITEDWTKWELPKEAKARLGKGGINVMQFSPDGTQLAVGSNIGVWLYDVKTGKEVTMFAGMCESLAFSPDGRYLVNGGGRFGSGGMFGGKTLQLWDIVTDQKVLLTNDFPSTSVLRFSEDGKTLVSLGKWGDSIGKLDVESRQGNVKNIKKRSWEIIKSRSVPEPYALTHDKFAVGGKDGRIELWDTTTGKKLSTLIGHANSVSVLSRLFGKNQDPSRWEVEKHNKHILALAFSPDGTRLASGSRDTTVRLWDITNRKVPIVLRKHTGWINVLAFSPDGKMLASGSTDKTVQLWDPATGKQLATLTGHISGIAALTFSPDGTILSSGSADGTVKFWSTETGAVLPTQITGHTEWVRAVAFFRDNTTLVSATVNGIISFWDLKTLQRTKVQMKRQQDWLSGLAFSSDGTQLVSAGSKGDVTFNGYSGSFSSRTNHDGLIHLIDVRTERELANLKTGHSSITFAFSPHGKTVAFSSFGNVCVWNTETESVLNNPLPDTVKLAQNGALVFPAGVNHDNLLHPNRTISALVFSPDGKKIVSGTWHPGQVEMWDVESGVVMTSFTVQNPKRENITTLSFSSSGALLAVGSTDRIRVMESSKLTLLREIDGSVETLLFAPDSTVLVTGLRNGVIELWDVETGDKLTTLDGHSGPIVTLIFSPDGKTLVSTGVDGTILVWDWGEVLEGINVGE